VSDTRVGMAGRVELRVQPHEGRIHTWPGDQLAVKDDRLHPFPPSERSPLPGRPSRGRPSPGHAPPGGRSGVRIPSLLAGGLLAGAILSAPAPSVGQEVQVSVGPDTSANVAPGDTLDLPVEVDLSASDISLAALDVTVTWDSDRLNFVTAAAGDFGSVSFDETAVSGGTLSASLSSGTGTSDSFTAFTLSLTAESTTGVTAVGIEVTAAASAAGDDLSGQVSGGSLDVCVASPVRFGDANGDGEVNVLDAQQIARLSAGLSASDPDRANRFGDVNEDAEVNVLDAQQIARFSVGLSGGRAGAETPGVCGSEIGNAPPTVQITAPAEGASFAEGEEIAFEGSAEDPEDGPLSGGALVWTSSLDGRIGTGASVATRNLAAGEHTITLTATDSEGAPGTATVGITVEAQPDLQVFSIAALPRGVLQDSTVELRAEIRNRGSRDAAAFGWTLSVVAAGTTDTTELRSGEIPGLAAGDTVALPTQADLGPFPVGGHELVLEVDPADAIPEAVETDNVRAERIQSYRTGFDIELQFLAQTDSATRQIFLDAAERWSEIITGDLGDIQLDPANPLDLSGCAEGAGQRTLPIDDLLILVRIDSIDGLGGVLGRAGPCFIRVSQEDPGLPPLTIAGAMEFDELDVAGLRAQGRLDETILHEMAHVLGLGTLWRLQGLIQGRGTDDPTFTGRQAIDAFFDVGGDGFSGDPVPVANTGGAGTRDAHWRESVFGTELMTGFLDQGQNPLSVVTIASFADQFYSVDESRAEPFQLDLGGGAGLSAGALHLGDDLLRVPIRGVDRFGVVYPVDPEELRRGRRGGSAP